MPGPDDPRRPRRDDARTRHKRAQESVEGKDGGHRFLGSLPHGGGSRCHARRADRVFRPMTPRILAFSLALWSAIAAAQTYPVKSVRILVPAQPGGGLDLVGRTMADQLGRALGQSFIVENSGGGGGSIASMTVARAAPDGYTLMVGYVGTHGTNPATRKVNYDAVRDFTPIAMVGGTPNLIVVHPSVPVRNLKELVERAKANPGKLTYGSGGIGTLNHLIWEQFRGAAAFDAVTVHYRGIGP